VVNPSATNAALISQTNDYYPFGMCYTKMPGPFVNKRKYNGKLKRSGNPDPSGEEQEMPGRWLDYGARFYDPQLGRWHGVDPLAEVSRRWSPYNYCRVCCLTHNEQIVNNLLKTFFVKVHE
jgi:RHS repeat-associated protein